MLSRLGTRGSCRPGQSMLPKPSLASEPFHAVSLSNQLHTASRRPCKGSSFHFLQGPRYHNAPPTCKVTAHPLISATTTPSPTTLTPTRTLTTNSSSSSSSSRVHCASNKGSSVTLHDDKAGGDDGGSTGNTHKWGIYNRIEERDKLMVKLRQTPTQMMVLTGPRSSGKTVFLGELSKELPGACYIDCNLSNSVYPEHFARYVVTMILTALRKEADRGGFWELLKTNTATKDSESAATLKQLVSKGGSEVLFQTIQDMCLGNAKKGEMPPPAIEPITGALEWARYLLEAVDSSVKLTLIIDHAHLLLTWLRNTDHAAVLEQLGALLTTQNKVENRCHVILATSQYSSAQALTKAMNIHDLEYLVLGNFVEEHAQGFITEELQKALNKDQQHLCDTIDEHWEQIYKIVGGNPLDLRRTAQTFAKTLDLPLALDEMARSGEDKVGQAWSNAGAGYSRTQLSHAIWHLIANGGVSTRTEMEQHLELCTGGKGDQQEAAAHAVLRALVEHNVLHVRPNSTWMKDITMKQHALGGGFVTAASPLMYHAMCKVYGQGSGVNKP